jgi:hypothetical protein
MGGQGSGRHRGFAQRRTVQDFAHRALRASALKGLDQQPGYTIYPWLRSGELIGSVRLCLRDRYIQVSYKEQDGVSFEQSVALDVTSCTYGGQRYWFRCPTCNRRATTLFVVRPPFGCRVCMGLAYESQRESAFGRTHRRAMRVQRRALDLALTEEGLEYGDFDEDLEEDDLDEDLAEGEFDGIDADIGDRVDKS